MARVVIESRVRARRRRRRALIVAGAACGVLLLCAALVAAANIPALELTSVAINGIPAAQAAPLKTYVEQKLAGDYLFFFPRANRLLYPKSGIERGLLADFSSLKSASVEAQGQILSVAVEPRAPVALWCGEAVASSSPCFLLDGDGLAYAALTISGDDFDRYFGALASSSAEQYLPPQAFHSLLALVAALKKDDASGVSSVLVDGDKDTTVSFNDGFSLIFALADADSTYQRFTLALQSDVFKQHPLSDFEYLDLRFGEKLYYKLKQQ